jgi:hypothetical protein
METAMNERIRQLAEQAEVLSHPEYEDEGLRNKRLYNEIFLPKFAELIVQECASIASNPATGCYTSFGNDIKKHFGVEE